MLGIPATDPVPIYELFNAGFGSKILVAASSHLHVFDRLAEGPKSVLELRTELDLSERAMSVLVTALRAFGLLARDAHDRVDLTPLARTHLLSSGEFDVSDYLELAAGACGVVDLVDRLRMNRPAGDSPTGKGAAYVQREGQKSAMDDERMARWLTDRLAGRAANTASLLCRVAPLPTGAERLVDVGGGTGIFSAAYLQQYPGLRASVLELPTVTPVVREYAARYGVADRLDSVDCDMFAAPFPRDADAILLSNVLHDWDVPECRFLVHKAAAALRPGGRLIVHDAFLDDDLGGPLHVAIYSVILFYLTNGRAYSAAECRGWVEEAGLAPQGITPTMVHCSAFVADRPG